MDLSSNVLVIVNPISGTKGKEKIIEYFHRTPSYTVAYTRGAGDATRMAAAAASNDISAVIAVGGDGTVREVAMGLLGGNIPLGIIPSGSGNGLARHLGLPLDYSKAMEIITMEHIVRCDCGMVGHAPFFCTMGVGFDAAVSHLFAESEKRGPIAYVQAALKSYQNYSPENYRIILPEKTIERKAFLLTIANAAQYGNNARIAPNASVTDGMLDVTILQAGDHLHTVEACLEMFAGGLHRNPLIETYRTPQVRIERSTPGNAHLDGEPLILPAAIDICIRPKALPIFTNPDRKI